MKTVIRPQDSPPLGDGKRCVFPLIHATTSVYSAAALDPTRHRSTAVLYFCTWSPSTRADSVGSGNTAMKSVNQYYNFNMSFGRKPILVIH